MLYLLSIVFSHENISFIGAHIFDFLCIGEPKYLELWHMVGAQKIVVELNAYTT